MLRVTRIATVATLVLLPFFVPPGSAQAAAQAARPGQGMTATATCLGTPGTIRLHVQPSDHGTVHADVSLTGLAATSWSGILTWDLDHVATTPLTPYDASGGSITASGDSGIYGWPATTYAGFQVTDDPQVGCTLAAAHAGRAYYVQSLLVGATVVASRRNTVEVRAEDVRKGERLTVIARVRTSKGWQKRAVKVVAKRAVKSDRIPVRGFTNLSAFRRAEIIVVRPVFGERDVLTLGSGGR